MEVELEFEHESQRYRLSRRWVPKPGRPLTSRDSITLHSLLQNLATDDSSRDDDEISDFVDDLLPRDISHFFLFDGEQIQEYTDAAAASVRDALERLLGLHPYIALLRDLGTLDGRMRSERESFDVTEDLNRRLGDQDLKDARLKAIERQRRELRSAASEAKRELAQLEREEDRIASVFDEEVQAKRRELGSARDWLEDGVRSHENELRQLISNELAVSWFWPEIVSASETLLASTNALPATLEELVGFIYDHREAISSALAADDDAMLRDAVAEALGGATEAFHSELGEGLEYLTDVVLRAKEKLVSVPRRLEAFRSDLNGVNHELDSLPSVESIGTDVQALHRRMDEYRTVQSRHEAGLRDLEREEKRLKEELAEVKREIEQLTGRHSKFNDLGAALSTSKDVQEAVGSFIDDYRRTRIDELEDVINRKYREFTNLPEVLERVQIDRDTFEITIRETTVPDIAAFEQSAGQKEVLAFALIASVELLSNKQLPAVIDTPLARLDTTHRDNIVRGFFPYAGPQVIIFATDTEIGREEYLKLKRFIASEHHLLRDTDSGWTKILEGYGLE